MKIDADAMPINLLLTNTKYQLDYYQREYSWQTQNVSELIDDLISNFFSNYKEGDNPDQVPNYSHYFLGSIIISNDNGKRHIVDGQQRLTTLTLLLIRIYHLLEDDDEKRLLEPLIYSIAGGKKGFNLDFQERQPVMDYLYPKDKRNDESFMDYLYPKDSRDNRPFEVKNKSDSVHNIAARYNDIEDYFEVRGKALSFFVSWLLENVYLVRISALNSRDAYSIFETVNDRGLSLTPTDMLGGYLLSHIEEDDPRNRANEIWRNRIQMLKQLGKNEESEAIKAWLRSQYVGSCDEAESVRDFDAIGSEFHRWVQERRYDLGLESPSDFFNFIESDFEFYTSWYYRLRNAANSYKEANDHGLECVYYNAQHNKFTIQYPILLAPLHPDDSGAENLQKVQIVAEYLDILIYRRIWNLLPIAQRTMADLMPSVIPIIRGKNCKELRDILHKRLQEEVKPFSNNSVFGFQGVSRQKIFLILARMTDYVGIQSEESSRYLEYMKTGRNRYEIEHIWANHLKHHADEFSLESDFEAYRNRIGGLLLLPKSINASSGDDLYTEKRKVYAGQNLLAKSLTEQAYKNNPGFMRFKENSGLLFREHQEFKKVDIDARQELYLRLAEQIWNPERLRTIHVTESAIVDEYRGSYEGENQVSAESSTLAEDQGDESIREWTKEKIKDLVTPELREHYETWHRNRVNEFYMRAADLKNFVEEKGWQLELKFRKIYCSFYIGSRRVFGVQIDYAPPRFAVFMSEKEVEHLSNHCEPEGYSNSRRYAFYSEGTTVEELRPILKSVYEKRRGN